MSEQPDVEAVAAWFLERQRLLFEVIEGTRYDLEEHVAALEAVVEFVRAGERSLAIETPRARSGVGKSADRGVVDGGSGLVHLEKKADPVLKGRLRPLVGG